MFGRSIHRKRVSMSTVRQILIVAGLLLAPTAASGQAQAQSASATLWSRVVSTDGRPIAGARVCLGEAGVTVGYSVAY